MLSVGYTDFSFSNSEVQCTPATDTVILYKMAPSSHCVRETQNKQQQQTHGSLVNFEVGETAGSVHLTQLHGLALLL